MFRVWDVLVFHYLHSDGFFLLVSRQIISVLMHDLSLILPPQFSAKSKILLNNLITNAEGLLFVGPKAASSASPSASPHGELLSDSQLS